MNTTPFATATLCCLTAAGCFLGHFDDEKHVHGSGMFDTEERVVEPFEQIAVTSGIEVEVDIDESEDGSVLLTVSGDDNLLRFVETEVVGATLRVDLSTYATLDSHYPLVVSARIPALVRGSVDHGASLEANDLDSWSLVLDVRNGGAAALTGEVEILDATIDSGALAWARYLDAERAIIDVADGAQAEICATEVVEGQVSGGAHVELFCNPDDVDVDVSSGGSLSQ